MKTVFDKRRWSLKWPGQATVGQTTAGQATPSPGPDGHTGNGNGNGNGTGNDTRPQDMVAPGSSVTKAARAARETLEKRGVAPASLTGRKAPPVSSTGVIDVGDAYFKLVCLLRADGTMYVVKDRNTPELMETLADLQREYELPEITTRKPATLSRIAAMRAESDRAAARAKELTGLNEGSRRIMRALEDAAQLGASDVKLVKRGSHADLRLKLANIEIDHGPEWTMKEAEDAVSFLFDLGDDGDGQASQQKGKYQPFAVSRSNILPDGVLALRVAKGPQGQSMHDFMVLRLVTNPTGGSMGDLEGLGLDGDVLEELERERTSESGLMLIGGSTGDGKSTTLVRWLERAYLERDGKVAITTVEDPIEYPAAGTGFIQMVVAGESSGQDRAAAYTEALRNFVRMNPDFGMVAEIRSVDDASQSLQFVVSGHKVVATIHAASALSAVFRLIRLGVNPWEVAEPGTISLAMRQTLVPVLCPDCARPATPVERAIINSWTGAPEGAPMIRNRAGCPTCLPPVKTMSPLVAQARKDGWGGLARRQAIAEYIRLDNRFRQFLQDCDPIGAESYWLTPKEDGGMGGRPLEMIHKDLVAGGRLDFTDATKKQLPVAEDGKT